MTVLRVVFMGTPDFAVPALDAITDAGHSIIAVYSQPPRPKGRGQQAQKSPVHLRADETGIPVYHPLSLKKDTSAVESFRALNADVAVVAAYGLILPQSVLDAPRYGCLNIHASLLPRWRGASPIQHAIWHGDDTSGVTIMQMDAGLDTGGMIEKRALPISGITAGALHDRLSTIGGEMIVDILTRLAVDGHVTSEKQDDTLSCYAPMLKKDYGRIDWTRTAVQIDAAVRALNPWPGTFTYADKKRVKILGGHAASGSLPPGTLTRDGHVGCGEGVYRITRLQPENGKAMDFAAALNGRLIEAGTVFTS